MSISLIISIITYLFFLIYIAFIFKNEDNDYEEYKLRKWIMVILPCLLYVSFIIYCYYNNYSKSHNFILAVCVLFILISQTYSAMRCFSCQYSKVLNYHQPSYETSISNHRKSILYKSLICFAILAIIYYIIYYFDSVFCKYSNLCCNAYIILLGISIYATYFIFDLIDYLNIKHTENQNKNIFNIFRGGNNLDFISPHREQNILNIIIYIIIIIIWILFLVMMLNSGNNVLKVLSVLLIFINFILSKKIINNCNNWEENSIHFISNYKEFSNMGVVLLIVIFIVTNYSDCYAL